MKKNFLPIVKFVLKYVVPVVLAWLEGDSHAAQDILTSVL